MLNEQQLKNIHQAMRMADFLKANPEDARIIEEKMPGTAAGLQKVLEDALQASSEEDRNQILETYKSGKPFGNNDDE